MEKQNKTIQDLVLTVRELALNMKSMIEEQKAQGKRMDKLEGRSGEDLEEQNKIIQKLTLSIKESELSMKNMIEEQKEQGIRFLGFWQLP